MANVVFGLGSFGETDVASAATCDIGAASTIFVRITGSVTITSFGPGTNRWRFIRFAAPLTLTHNAVSLQLPTNASIAVEAGDTCVARSTAGGDWIVVQYQRDTGAALVASPYASGRFYPLYPGTSITTNAVLTPDTVISLVPFELRRPMAITSLSVRVITGVASSAVKMGIWASNPATGAPTGLPISGLVSNTGQSTATSSTTATISPGGATIGPGLYWYGAAFTLAPSMYAIAASSNLVASLYGRSAVSSAVSSAYTTPFTYGSDITALNLTGATLTDQTNNTGVPIVFAGT